MEIGKDDVKDIMAIVSACAQDLYPDDAIKQAEHINNSYGSLLNLMGEVEWKQEWTLTGVIHQNEWL